MTMNAASSPSRPRSPLQEAIPGNADSRDEGPEPPEKNFEVRQCFHRGTADAIPDVFKLLEMDMNSRKILEEALDSDMDFLKVLEEEEDSRAAAGERRRAAAARCGSRGGTTCCLAIHPLTLRKN